MQQAERVGHPGWFYRILAPSSGVRALEVGEAGLAAWFDDVDHATRIVAPAPDGSRRYDLVVLHRALGGCGELPAAAAAGAALLAEGGTFAIAGDNAWRTRPHVGAPPVPRGSAGAFGRALRRAGLRDIAVFAAIPPDADPEHVVQVDAASARPFYRMAARSGASGLRALGLRLLVEANLMPRLARGFVAVGRRC